MNRKHPLTMFDFQRLEKEIYAAAKAAFRELVERSHPEPLCAFALYSDEGAMTVCPAANTEAHLAKTQKVNPDFATDYTFSPAEWAFEGEGANDYFNAICSQLSERLDNDDSALFTACGNSLKTLKEEQFFESTAGRPVIVLFSSSDADSTAQDVAMVRTLNDAATGDAYERWARTFNDV